MNREQIRYAVKRVTDIENRLLQSLNKSDFETSAVTFDAEKRFKLFKQGKFRIEIEGVEKNPFHSKNCYAYFQNIVLVEGERKYHFDKDKFETVRNKIKSEADRIRDILNLGNAEDALKLIEKFEKFKSKKGN